MGRAAAKLLDDILLATDVAAEIVKHGRDRFAEDHVLQFGAEAVIGRIGDAASKLPDDVRASISDVPWKEVIGFRIIVDHVYHRLNYDRVWNTLVADIPQLRAAIQRYRLS
jgi:uncharacterized protein with HEPN domain